MNIIIVCILSFIFGVFCIISFKEIRREIKLKKESKTDDIQILPFSLKK
jgi:hypothetical protein